MRAYINNQWYNVDDGATITINFNETLDSASIRISHLPSQLDLEPFDEIKIEYPESNTTKTKWFCVNNFTETRKAFDKDDNMYYTYEIELFSPTKILENTLLPNISITPIRDGIITIKGFISRVMLQFSPKKYIPREYDEELEEYYGDYYADKYDIDLSVLNDPRFQRKCPELQWNTPTLREVLNDLFMLCDCLPYLDLEDNKIKALDLSQTSGYEVDYDDINYVQRTQSSNDYASELKMNLQNVTQTDTTDVRTTVNTYEALSFTTDNYVVTDNNYYLQTKFPILRINHLWVNWMTNNSDPTEMRFWRVDLCNLQFTNDITTYSLVVEKQAYDVLPIKKYVALAQESTTSIANFANDKNNCCYYVRGTNIITGFSDTQKINVLGMVTSTLERILWAAEHDKGNTSNSRLVYSRITEWQNAYFHPTFEIEYETSAGCLFSANKSKKPKHDRTIMDNQTNAWVDISSQIKLESLKADRISNKMYFLNSRKEFTDRYIHIGDVYDNDKIVYNTTWQFNQNNCLVNAYATEKYVLRDYFTGIDSKIRIWNNAREEAFIRHELRKYYITATLNPLHREVEGWEEYTIFRLSVPDGYIMFNVYWLLSPLIPIDYMEGHRWFKRAYIQTEQYGVKYPDDRYYFVTELSTRYADKTILFTTGFEDNRVALKKVSTGFHPAHPAGEPTLTTREDGIVAREDLSLLHNPATIAQDSIKDLGILPDSNFEYKSSKEHLGGIPLKSYMYADEEARFKQIKIWFSAAPTGDLYPRNLTPVDDSDGREYYITRLENQIFEPLDEIFYAVYGFYKDNKEIFQITTQFDFISDTEDVVLTEDFVRMHQMIYTGSYGNWEDFTYSYIDSEGNEHFVNGHHTITIDPETKALKKITIEIYDEITGTPEWYCIYRQGKLLVKTKYLIFYIELRAER